jgi:transcriptional regulator
MYIPKHFREDDPATLYDLIRQHNFAALVTHHDGQLMASHLPFMVDAERGLLLAHLARANPQWQDFAEGREVLVIFQGPHAYITPSWYAAAPSNVPTWNYAVVHAYGTPRIVEDHAEMYAMLDQLVREHEAGFEHPWPMQASDDYVHRRIEAVVGLAIHITRLEGKFKLSQNRSEADRAQVIEGLAERSNPLDRATADLMRAARK